MAAENNHKNNHIQHVFIIGCKGIPAQYGGFETFVDKLTQYQADRHIRYHVACAAEPEAYDPKQAHFRCHHAVCVTFPWRRLGSARAILYDIDALRYFIDYAKKKQIPHPVFYILACRIGPFISHFCRQIHALGGELYVNPDGHEFLRAKWSAPVRRYWKLSERLMVKHADLLVCDSQNIEAYIRKEYAPYRPNTTFIAYGAETVPSKLAQDDQELLAWYAKNGVQAQGYYLVVGRFVPENNYETMIREFMKSRTKRDFVIISTANDRFLEKLENKLHFRSDSRIKFVGTVYDQELLKKIREQAYGYLHGHEVGGTNPSLLEALGATKLNLLLDVGFNKEVAKEGAIYWTKEKGNLARLIEKTDHMESEEIKVLESKAKSRIQEEYSWERIADLYEKVFLRLER